MVADMFKEVHFLRGYLRTHPNWKSNANLQYLYKIFYQLPLYLVVNLPHVITPDFMVARSAGIVSAIKATFKSVQYSCHI